MRIADRRPETEIRSDCRTPVTSRAALVLAALAAVALRAGPVAALPTADELMTAIGLSADQKQQVMSGQLVNTTPPETSDRELAVAMAFLISKPPADLEAYFKAGTGYKQGPDVTAYGPISSPGALSDFSKVALTPAGADEAKRYLKASPGNDLNLSPQEIAAFQALNAQVQGGANPQQVVTAQVQQNLLARYQAYKAQGLAGIAPYARSGTLYDPAADLRKATSAAKVLQQDAPAFAAVLAQYPQSEPPGFQESFFWINYAMEKRPNFVLVHRMVQQIGPHAYALASRQFYAARDYNTVQEIGGMLPVQEGTLVVYLNRTSTDQAAGFGSAMKHSIGRKMMGDQLAKIFKKSQARAAGK